MHLTVIVTLTLSITSTLTLPAICRFYFDCETHCIQTRIIPRSLEILHQKCLRSYDKYSCYGEKCCCLYVNISFVCDICLFGKESASFVKKEQKKKKTILFTIVLNLISFSRMAIFSFNLRIFFLFRCIIEN